MNRTFEWRAAIAVMWVRSNHQSGTTPVGKYQPFEWDLAMPARWQLIVPARLNGIYSSITLAS